MKILGLVPQSCGFMKNMKNKILLLTIFLLFFTIIAQLALMSILDSYNVKVGNLVSEYGYLNTVNQSLQEKVSSAESITNIQNQDLKSGYSSINSYAYVPSGGVYSLNVSK